MAYVDCTIVVLTNGDPLLCNCIRVGEAYNIPVVPDQPNKEKEISLKTDWKYIGVTVYTFSNPSPEISKPIASYKNFSIPKQNPADIFHPPQS